MVDDKLKTVGVRAKLLLSPDGPDFPLSQESASRHISVEGEERRDALLFVMTEAMKRGESITLVSPDKGLIKTAMSLSLRMGRFARFMDFSEEQSSEECMSVNFNEDGVLRLLEMAFFGKVSFGPKTNEESVKVDCCDRKSGSLLSLLDGRLSENQDMMEVIEFAHRRFGTAFSQTGHSVGTVFGASLSLDNFFIYVPERDVVSGKFVSALSVSPLLGYRSHLDRRNRDRNLRNLIMDRPFLFDGFEVVPTLGRAFGVGLCVSFQKMTPDVLGISQMSFDSMLANIWVRMATFSSGKECGFVSGNHASLIVFRRGSEE